MFVCFHWDVRKRIRAAIEAAGFKVKE